MTSADNHKPIVAIIGAGPIGLEAALHVEAAGLRPVVLERGEVGANVKSWGHIRLFSPFEMNASDPGRREVAAHFGAESLPASDALLTGRDFATHYLEPLSRLPQLQNSIRTQTTVAAVSRRWLQRGELIGSTARLQDRFELLLEDQQGEHLLTADFVLDCSGTYPNHRWIGAGGKPCPGERKHLAAADYRLIDIAGSERSRFAGSHTLVVGSGYSAATAIVALGLLLEHPETRVDWLTRGNRSTPMNRIADDALPERDRIARRANELAATSPSVRWIADQRIVRIHRATGGRLQVQFEDRAGIETTAAYDNLVACPGFRPDLRLHEELQIHHCYATDGPMKLAASLLGTSSPDCLTQPTATADQLRNPEPGFFVLGSRSYGRNSQFLLRNGLSQIEQVIPLLTPRTETLA